MKRKGVEVDPIWDMNRWVVIFFIGFLGCTSKMAHKAGRREFEVGTILKVDTTEILGQKYIGIATDDHELFVLTPQGDTVLNKFEAYSDFEFIDFNGDNLSDIVVPRSAAVAGLQDLLLFNAKEVNFTLVKNFTEFPDAQPVEGTMYYYSYHRSGCADNFWNSDLFYIDSFEAHIVGDIAGNECEGDTGIVVRKIANGDTTVVERFTLDVLESYNDRKWGFIADYWKKNHEKVAF